MGMPGWAMALGAPLAVDKLVVDPIEGAYKLYKGIRDDQADRNDKAEGVRLLQQVQNDPNSPIDLSRFSDPNSAAVVADKLLKMRDVGQKTAAAPVLSMFGKDYRNAVGTGDFTDPDSLAVLRQQGVDAPTPEDMQNPYVRQGVDALGEQGQRAADAEGALSGKGSSSSLGWLATDAAAPNLSVLQTGMNKGEEAAQKTKSLADFAAAQDVAASYLRPNQGSQNRGGYQSAPQVRADAAAHLSQFTNLSAPERTSINTMLDKGMEDVWVNGQNPYTGKEINRTKEQLYTAAQRGDKESAAVLAKMQADELAQSKAKRQVIVNNPIPRQAPAAGHGGAGTDEYSKWTPQEKQWWFENMRATGQKPDLGAGGASSKARQQFTREYAAWSRGEGISGADAAVMADTFKTDAAAYKGSIVQQQKAIGAMGSFVKNMDAQIAKVGELSAALHTFDSRILNLPLRAARGRIAGSPLQAKYDMYLTEIESEIGKLATGSAGSVAELSIGAQEKWAKIHDKNLSVKDMLELLKETSHAGKLRMKSVADQLEETREQSRARGKSPATAAPAKKVVVERRRAASGKVLVKYSDGSIGAE
jgi:hypothetical protein